MYTIKKKKNAHVLKDTYRTRIARLNDEISEKKK